MLSLFVNTTKPWYFPSSNWSEQLDCGRRAKGRGKSRRAIFTSLMGALASLLSFLPRR